MSTGEIQALLIDLDGLARETERAERKILRKAQDRLSQLLDTPNSESEKRLLRGVIYRVEAEIGMNR
ncbi:hypothetical protein [Pseudomonas sp. Irchel s3h17]|uniref:hypothetical protein n=1 Tax=Pseudomonas sp. Irchel s3h17 TaxID=2009182 RepID=UPI000BA4250C|nr:hypothetical protein [Pseudomonas sp. Irchel s3h17]